MITIIPGINEINFTTIKQQIDLVKGVVDWVQIDIMDHTLVDIDTYNNWEAFQMFQNNFSLEAHLMVADPAKYVALLVNHGFKRLIAQVEGNTVRDFLHLARIHETEVGLALDSTSPLETVEPFLDEVSVILLMMYPMGASGQAFQPQNLKKIQLLHQQYPNLPIEVDGGIDEKTAPLVIENGATRLVSTSYLFKKNPQRIKDAIAQLQALAK